MDKLNKQILGAFGIVCLLVFGTLGYVYLTRDSGNDGMTTFNANGSKIDLNPYTNPDAKLLTGQIYENITTGRVWNETHTVVNGQLARITDPAVVGKKDSKDSKSQESESKFGEEFFELLRPNGTETVMGNPDDNGDEEDVAGIMTREVLEQKKDNSVEEAEDSDGDENPKEAADELRDSVEEDDYAYFEGDGDDLQYPFTDPEEKGRFYIWNAGDEVEGSDDLPDEDEYIELVIPDDAKTFTKDEVLTLWSNLNGNVTEVQKALDKGFSVTTTIGGQNATQPVVYQPADEQQPVAPDSGSMHGYQRVTGTESNTQESASTTGVSHGYHKVT